MNKQTMILNEDIAGVARDIYKKLQGIQTTTALLLQLITGPDRKYQVSVDFGDALEDVHKTIKNVRLSTGEIIEIATSKLPGEECDSHGPARFRFGKVQCAQRLDHTPAPGEPGCISQSVTRKKGNKPESAGK